MSRIIILVSTCQAFLVTHNLISSGSSSALISSPGMPKEGTETGPFRVRVFKADVSFPKCYPVWMLKRNPRQPIKCDVCDQNGLSKCRRFCDIWLPNGLLALTRPTSFRLRWLSHGCNSMQVGPRGMARSKRNNQTLGSIRES